MSTFNAAPTLNNEKKFPSLNNSVVNVEGPIKSGRIGIVPDVIDLARKENSQVIDGSYIPVGLINHKQKMIDGAKTLAALSYQVAHFETYIKVAESLKEQGDNRFVRHLDKVKDKLNQAKEKLESVDYCYNKNGSFNELKDASYKLGQINTLLHLERVRSKLDIEGISTNSSGFLALERERDLKYKALESASTIAEHFRN
jgi:hypothetical protein